MDMKLHRWPAVLRQAFCAHRDLVRVQVEGVWYFACPCGYQTPVLRRTLEEAAKSRAFIYSGRNRDDG
jgi:hypothetical protein